MKRQPHSSRTTSSENIGAPGGDACALRDYHDLGQVAGSGLITVKEVARPLGMSERRIHERTRLNEIPCYRLGTALRFDPQEIRDWARKFHCLREEQ
jgi:excisionase family DNA binding protein